MNLFSYARYEFNSDIYTIITLCNALLFFSWKNTYMPYIYVQFKNKFVDRCLKLFEKWPFAWPATSIYFDILDIEKKEVKITSAQ